MAKTKGKIIFDMGANSYKEPRLKIELGDMFSSSRGVTVTFKLDDVNWANLNLMFPSPPKHVPCLHEVPLRNLQLMSERLPARYKMPITDEEIERLRRAAGGFEIPRHDHTSDDSGGITITPTPTLTTSSYNAMIGRQAGYSHGGSIITLPDLETIVLDSSSKEETLDRATVCCMLAQMLESKKEEFPCTVSIRENNDETDSELLLAVFTEVYDRYSAFHAVNKVKRIVEVILGLIFKYHPPSDEFAEMEYVIGHIRDIPLSGSGESKVEFSFGVIKHELSLSRHFTRKGGRQIGRKK